MPLVATNTYTNDMLQPVNAAADAGRTIAITLQESTTFPKGSALVEGTAPGKYRPYNGSGTPTLLLKRACITDATGQITYGTAATGMEQGQVYPATDAYYAGLFRTADLPQAGAGAIDAAALAAGSIGRLIGGTLVSGLLRIGG